jgi:drug/metabolite transporter (DMT)-like permease
MALSNYFQNLGLLLTTPGKNAFLTTSYCIMVPFLYWIIGRSKPDRFNIFAAVICLFGIGMISLNEKFYITEGDFLTLLGGLLIAFQIVFFAVSSFKYDVVLITIVQFATSAIVSLFLHLIFEKIPAVSSFSSSIILQLLYLAVFCTLITMLLQNIGQKHVYPAQASIILSLEAVFAVIFSILFFNEHPSFQIYIGFLAMLMSVIISEGKPRFGKLKKLK